MTIEDHITRENNMNYRIISIEQNNKELLIEIDNINNIYENKINNLYNKINKGHIIENKIDLKNMLPVI